MIEFAYHFILVCHEKMKKLRRKSIDYKTTKEQRETMQGSERRRSESSTSRLKVRCDRDRKLANGSTACEGGRGRWNGGGEGGEKIRDATAKSDRAVKITISPLWCAPRTLKWEGPVSVGGIHHRARVTRRYIFLGTRLENRYFM